MFWTVLKYPVSKQEKVEDHPWVETQVNSSIGHINALIDSRVFQQARDQYMACMDLEKIEEKGLEPLLSLLKKFGGWPVLEDNWNEANFKWYLFAIIIMYLF